MARAKPNRSDALRSLHEIAEDLHAGGAIDKATMHEFELSRHSPVKPLSLEEIKDNLELPPMSKRPSQGG